MRDVTSNSNATDGQHLGSRLQINYRPVGDKLAGAVLHRAHGDIQSGKSTICTIATWPNNRKLRSTGGRMADGMILSVIQAQLLAAGKVLNGDTIIDVFLFNTFNGGNTASKQLNDMISCDHMIVSLQLVPAWLGCDS